MVNQKVLRSKKNGKFDGFHKSARSSFSTFQHSSQRFFKCFDVGLWGHAKKHGSIVVDMDVADFSPEQMTEYNKVFTTIQEKMKTIP